MAGTHQLQNPFAVYCNADCMFSGTKKSVCTITYAFDEIAILIPIILHDYKHFTDLIS